MCISVERIFNMRNNHFQRFWEMGASVPVSLSNFAC